MNIGASLRIWLNDLCGDRSIVSARWRQLAPQLIVVPNSVVLHGTPVTNTQTDRQTTRRNSSHRTLLVLVCGLTNSLEIHKQRAIDEHSNLHHRFKPCTFGVYLLGTGSGNMTSDIGQANAVGRRFVIFMFPVYSGWFFECQLTNVKCCT